MDISAILQRRDRQSFDWLYSQYAGTLFGAIRKMVAENVKAEKLLQETFVSVWASLDQFEGKSGELLLWMLRIARARVDEYITHCDGESHHQQEKNSEFWKASSQPKQAGRKQYFN